MVNINKIMPSGAIRPIKPKNREQTKSQHNGSVEQAGVKDSIKKKDNEAPNKHIDERI